MGATDADVGPDGTGIQDLKENVTSNDHIAVQRDGAWLSILINRPKKANSLTPAMLISLRDLFRNAASDPTLCIVVITGAGDRVFCAGADLNTLYDEQNDPDLWAEMVDALRNIPVPTIAAINGPCMGGGVSLALGCDILLAVPEARFSYPFLKNNVLPGQYDVDGLHALIGPGRAAVMLLGGSVVLSEEALTWGLVDRLVPSDGLEEACLSLYETAALSDGRRLRALKSMINMNPS